MHHIVPKAPRVAGPSHPVMPDAMADSGLPATAAQPDACGLACPYSGAPCPALAAFFPHFETVAGPDAADIQAFVRSLMPCGQCRVASAAGRDTLRHMRLGQRERDILLAAAAQDALVLTEPGMTRSLSAARRRAALSLGKAGLVAPVVTSAVSGPKDSGNSAKTAPRATIALTPLGRYVMTAYGRFITAGKPVRWTRPARGAVLPGRDPSDLIEATLALTQTALRDTLNELKGVLIAAVGRPLKSPGLLDTLTRHLERKATLLKAVLEPSRSLAPAPTATARSPA
jgi:hypothetical protein